MRHCILLLCKALYLTALLVVGQVAACGRATISLHEALYLTALIVVGQAAACGRAMFALPLGPDCGVCK